MKLIKNIIKAVSIIVVVIGLGLVLQANVVHAYWASTMTQEEVSIKIGNWGQELEYPKWNDYTKYNKGDRVYHNGNVYEARVNNPQFEPGTFIVSGVHWRRL